MRSDEYEDQEEEYGKSKSQLKREMHALQTVGEQMLDLSDEQLATLSISSRLKDAIVESRRITKREARRRHLQYIGKIIRQEDDPEGLERQIQAFHAGSEEHTRRHHLAEQWRDRIIAEGEPAVSAFIDYCSASDIQHLRNLTRNARKEAQGSKNLGHARKLFRYLRECIDDAESA